MSCRILQARYVFPVVGEPIENGFVRFEGERIVEVGKKPAHTPGIDLGNVALLPGLVNAHTHLEIPSLPDRPVESFTQWLRTIIAWRKEMPCNDRENIMAGLRECVKEGVTCVGNISQPGESNELFQSSRCRGTRFLELLAPNRSRLDAADSLLQPWCSQPESKSSGWRWGLSPHAPYSVRPELLHAVVAQAVLHQIPLAMHLAESLEEMQLLEEGTGPFREFLEERDAFDPSVFPGGRRPLDYLKILAEAPHASVIHGNYLNAAEIDFLARRKSQMAVVYCPRTHQAFRHSPYPLEKMLAAGVTVGLGTDSRASSPDLSILAEMRAAAKQFPHLPGETMVKLGTLEAARCLGRSESLGSIERGKLANFAVVPLPDENRQNPYESLLSSPHSVSQTWVKGEKIETSPSNCFPTNCPPAIS